MASLVYLKNKANGTTYVYENISTWNKEKKRCDTKRKLVGKLDAESGETVPCSPTGRPRKEGAEAPHANVVATGQSLLLGKASGSLGLPGILKEAFGSEPAAKIPTCAYFLVCEGKAISHASTWSAANGNPYGGVLASQRTSGLLCCITREGRRIFSRCGQKPGERSSAWLSTSRAPPPAALLSGMRGMATTATLRSSRRSACSLWLAGRSGMPIFFEAPNGAIKDASALENALLAMAGWASSARMRFWTGAFTARRILAASTRSVSSSRREPHSRPIGQTGLWRRPGWA
ncbi:MAG: hypothetical protein FWG10_11170 [Eubacteriaceae bacterium]|nr:hypothetical protein [Eubacteriaceae bacterium]